MKKEIENILQKRKTKFQGLKVVFKKYNLELYKTINSSHINTENFSEKVYRILHDLEDTPLCKHCNLTYVSKFINFELGYGEYCSRKCATNSKKTKEKIKKTCMEKYGGSGGASKSIYKKILSTLQKNHNVTNSSQLGGAKRTIMLKWFKGLTNERLGNCTPMFDFETYYKHGRVYFDYEFLCNKCKTIFKSYFTNGHIPLCPTCNPINTYKSKMENELILYIKSIYCGTVVQSNRSVLKNMELDIYLPDLNIAIELNGLYWHSDVYKDKKYHLIKTQRCEDIGIQLIHIFEDEWAEKKEIVFRRIKHILHQSEKIYARKCTILQISSKVCNEFLERIHIQGKCRSSVRYGLYDNKELISVMTFSKPRYNKNYQWELIRFASSKSVVGGGSKLLTHFKRDYKPSSIISYADRRWSMGNIYKKLGFSFKYNTTPNYFYIKRIKRFSRIMFQKHKLKNILKDFNENNTEYENMKNNGFHRIYDCGNMVFVWSR